jgi:hypothetical protein
MVQCFDKIFNCWSLISHFKTFEKLSSGVFWIKNVKDLHVGFMELDKKSTSYYVNYLRYLLTLKVIISRLYPWHRKLS